MKYLKRFNESLLDDIRNKTDKNLSDIKGKVGFSGKNHKFCHECGEKLEKVATFCSECGEKQEMDNYTISGTLTKKGYDLILRSPAKFLDGTKINLMIRDKCNDCTLPLNKEVKIIGTTKNGEKPGFNNPIIVKSPENISVIK